MMKGCRMGERLQDTMFFGEMKFSISCMGRFLNPTAL